MPAAAEPSTVLVLVVAEILTAARRKRTFGHNNPPANEPNNHTLTAGVCASLHATFRARSDSRPVIADTMYPCAAIDPCRRVPDWCRRGGAQLGGRAGRAERRQAQRRALGSVVRSVLDDGRVGWTAVSFSKVSLLDGFWMFEICCTV